MVLVLLIEENVTEAETLQSYLLESGHCRVKTLKSFKDINGVLSDSYDAIVVDLWPISKESIQGCEKLRDKFSCPIISISSLNDPSVLAKTLYSGADDYIVKPVDKRILMAKLHANIRQSKRVLDLPINQLIKFENFELDVARKIVSSENGTFPLTPIEFSILLHFVQHPGNFFTPEQIYSIIWEQKSEDDARTVYTHIHNIRSKIEPDNKCPKRLVNKRGKGYSFMAF